MAKQHSTKTIMGKSRPTNLGWNDELILCMKAISTKIQFHSAYIEFQIPFVVGNKSRVRRKFEENICYCLCNLLQVEVQIVTIFILFFQCYWTILIIGLCGQRNHNSIKNSLNRGPSTIMPQEQDTRVASFLDMWHDPASYIIVLKFVTGEGPWILTWFFQQFTFLYGSPIWIIL